MSYDEVGPEAKGPTPEEKRAASDKERKQLKEEMRRDNITRAGRHVTQRSAAAEVAQRSHGITRRAKVYGGTPLERIGMAGTKEKQEEVYAEYATGQGRRGKVDLTFAGPSLLEKLSRCETRKQVEEFRAHVKGLDLSPKTRRRFEEAVLFARLRVATKPEEVQELIGDSLAARMNAETRRRYRAYVDQRLSEIRAAALAGGDRA